MFYYENKYKIGLGCLFLYPSSIIILYFYCGGAFAANTFRSACHTPY